MIGKLISLLSPENPIQLILLVVFAYIVIMMVPPILDSTIDIFNDATLLVKASYNDQGLDMATEKMETDIDLLLYRLLSLGQIGSRTLAIVYNIMSYMFSIFSTAFEYLDMDNIAHKANVQSQELEMKMYVIEREILEKRIELGVKDEEIEKNIDLINEKINNLSLEALENMTVSA